ncbi:uncharacterized protein LOC117646953 isoform X1 [Thrips palmi]|uniref:Uncharacterized protein LOC117646953 isoform X1 n=1 Tax=Thrips palmi TaxID=161013 RepID=A0A6P8YVW1_THRPL|nr:uncharacterized protein LOC117646953 isoform X1 [Thrips palmi]
MGTATRGQRRPGRASRAALLLLTLVVAVCLHCCSAGVAATGCVHKGRRYAAGAVWTTPGACVEQECGEDGAVTTTWCGHFMAGPNCRFVRGNLSAPYPECCPQLRCVKTTA